MKRDGKYRFSLQFGSETREQVQAGELLERLGNRKSAVVIDFQVTPHQLRHTYITNLIYSGADPKTVQYLAGHKHSKITMDIYAKVKYNKPKELSSVVNKAFAPKKGATPNKTRNG